MPGILFNRPAPLLDLFLRSAPSPADTTMDSMEVEPDFSVENQANYTTEGGGIRKLRARPPVTAPVVPEQPKLIHLEQTISDSFAEVRQATADGYDTITFG
jgi:hypothetical protein